MPPIASTHAPASRATYTLRTSMRNASTSPSNRAPNIDVVRVCLAIRPSTASSTSATTASATRIVTAGGRTNESAVSAATPQASMARMRVTRSAGPSTVTPFRASPPVTAAFRTTPQASPTTQPRPLRPTVIPSVASRATSAVRHTAGPVRTPSIRTSNAMATAKVTYVASVRISESGELLMRTEALAFWVREPGAGEIRPVRLPEPGTDDVVVRTLRSGISRGTETLVFRGQVPKSQYSVMRAPFQEGEFPGPVKYGYLNVGVVEHGPRDLRDRTVFCLYPHQTAYVVPAAAVLPVPGPVPPERAVLAGPVETAVNALWDAAPLVGDRVTVVGAGMVGCCVARLLPRFPDLDVPV